MQILLALPDAAETSVPGQAENVMFQKVCGVPLLTRVVATACRSGGSEVLVLHPSADSEDFTKRRLDSAKFVSVPVRTLVLGRQFDPENVSDWREIEDKLEPRFLWLPWNSVTDKRTLSRLIEAGKDSTEGARFLWSQESQSQDKNGDSSHGESLRAPAVIVKTKLRKILQNERAEHGSSARVLSHYLADTAIDLVSLSYPPSILAGSAASARMAERSLVRRSGKDTDGIYSKFNRRLCRPVVRWLSKTSVTPNMVSFAGLGVALLSGYAYAQGRWSALVGGALLYFLSVLFDEMDGMLARITFRESAFGCWLETFVDYASYVVLFAGMTIGLYRQGGAIWLVGGGLLLFGTLMSIVVISFQRKLATDPDRPHELLGRFQRRLEQDSGNIISRFARQAEFVIRKAPFAHFVVIFTLLGGVKVLFLFVAFGTNVIWLLALYFNRLFRQPSLKHPTSAADCCGVSFHARIKKGA